MGDPNASIPTPEPVHYRPMFGGFGGALAASRVTFLSSAGVDAGVAASLGLRSPILPVKGIRDVGKAQMIHNATMPEIEVDPETYLVHADGELLTCEPAAVLPLAQRYFLF